MGRAKRVLIANETLRIVASGAYDAPSGHASSIADETAACCEGTRLIRPDDFAAFSWVNRYESTRIEVLNETTFAGARALIEQGGDDVCALNFASAKNPGGGFLRGTQAQEEALARASALYESLLRAPEYYEYHRQSRGNALYSHHMIYSPAVPVFRDDADELIDHPWCVSIITSPAVNVRDLAKNLADRIEPVMRERIDHVLSLAAARGHADLVLGAWGCGVFRNAPTDIADLFADALKSERFRGAFRRVRFSVLDDTADRANFRAFESRLAS